MKKTVVLIAFLFVMSVALVAVQASTTTSYDPTKRIENPSPSLLFEMKQRATDGEATAQEMAMLNKAQQNFVVAPAIGTRDDATVYPQGVANWTGTTTSSAITDNNEVRGYNTEDGWFMFDVSGIPAGSIISNIQFNGYVNATYYPYWSMTPLTSDPLTADAATLSADIVAEQSSGYYLYQNESSSYATGWKQLNLGGTAVTDCQNALTQGWFAMGMASRDNSTSWYINWYGWNDAGYEPYLVISYLPPVSEASLMSGTVSPENGMGDTEFTYEVLYANPTGNAPTQYDVVIDGSSYAMTPPAGTPDYTAWQTFTYTTTLSGGSHEYYFDFVAEGSGLVLPETAPTTPFYGPTVFVPLSGTYVIDAAGGGDFTTFQECFDVLVMVGTDGAPVNIEVAAGTYEETAVLVGPLVGPDASNMVHFYPQGGEVIVDGSTGLDVAPLYLQSANYLWIDGFTLTGGSNAGIRSEYTDGVWISNCNANYNGWMGICTIGCTNTLIWNNMSSNNLVQQIRIDGGGVGSGNVLWNNSTYPLYSNGYDGTYCMLISDDEVSVVNNIFHLNHNAGGGYCVYIGVMDLTTHPNTFSDHNDFYVENGLGLIYLADSDVVYTDLAAWQTASGLDGNSVVGDPLFNDPDNTDLHIAGIGSEYSAAYQTGTNTGAWFMDDFDGDTRVTPWDMGADMIVPPTTPVFEDGDINFKTGHQYTAYEWSVHYFHPAGTAPTSIQLVRDGNPFGAVNMTLQDGVAGNGIYSYSSTMAVGTHTYYFTANTDQGPIRFPETGSETGPIVTSETPEAFPYIESWDGLTELPATWTTQGLGEDNWFLNASNSAGGETPELYFYYDPSFDGMSRLVSPMIDTSGQTQLELLIQQYVADFSSGYDIGVATTSNGGYTWNTAWSMVGAFIDPSELDITISTPDVGSDHLQFCFFFDGPSYNIDWWIIDDLRLIPWTPYDVEFITADQTGAESAGNDLMYAVEIQNTGISADTFDLTVEGNTWTTTFWNTPDGTRRSQITDTGLIDAGATATIYVKVHVDELASNYTTDTAAIIATSQSDSYKTDFMLISTDCVPSYEFGATIDFTALSGYVGNTVTYTVTIENTGSIDDTYTLSVANNNWTTSWVDGASIAIVAGDADTAEIEVIVEGAGGETDVPTLTVTSDGDPTMYAEFIVTTTAIGTEGEGLNFYYTWMSSMNPAGPEYDWYEPVTRESITLPSDDGKVGPITIGFDFPYYGQTKTEYYVEGNGGISFQNYSLSFTNTTMPNTSTPNDLIALFWDDLNSAEVPVDGTPAIFVEDAVIDEMNAHVITYDHYGEYDSNDNGYYLTAQLILFENGNIKMQYKYFYPGFDMTGATIGIENSTGTDAVLYEFDADYIQQDEFAIMYYYTPLNLTNSQDGVNLMLDWDEVQGAEYYKVYSSTDPYATFPDNWTLETETATTEYTEALTTGKFFIVSFGNSVVLRAQSNPEVRQEVKETK